MSVVIFAYVDTFTQGVNAFLACASTFLFDTSLNTRMHAYSNLQQMLLQCSWVVALSDKTQKRKEMDLLRAMEYCASAEKTSFSQAYIMRILN
jgi:hypothetical protein